MNKYSKFAALAVVGIGLVGAAVGTARAGAKATGNTLQISGMGRLAYGSLADIRSSGDNTSYFKCSVDTVAPGFAGAMNGAGTGVTSVVCEGHDAGSMSFKCSSTDPGLIAAARSIHSDSYVLVSWDQTATMCTEIGIITSSIYAPKY